MRLDEQFPGKLSWFAELLQQPLVTDVLVNGTESFFVERAGVLEEQSGRIATKALLWELVERVVLGAQKKVDLSQPCADGSLCDGTRFHVVIPPIAPTGPNLCFRTPRTRLSLTLGDFGNELVQSTLAGLVSQRKSVLISGGTGSGKTSLLSLLLDQVDANERVLLLEEAGEIQTSHPHVIRLEARTALSVVNPVDLRQLLIESLRMRPDRVIVGECRGGEAIELLQAMNTGHVGSFSTIHANSGPDALRRLESLLLLGGLGVGAPTARDWMSRCLDFVVHMERLGSERKVTEIWELRGMEGEVIRLRCLYQLPRSLPRSRLASALNL